MESALRNSVKFVLACLSVLVLTAAVFLAGFGSAYVLTGSGVLPTWSSVPTWTAAAPTPTPPLLPSPTEAQEELPPTPTPWPIPAPTNEDEETFQLFWEVWDLVQHHFYGPLPDTQELTYAAIRGMLSTLGDEYTAFIEPDVAAVIAEDATGQFEGIGAFVDMDEQGRVVIVGLFEDGPAQTAGLREDDRILEVDGVLVVGRTLYEAIGLIRGPAGSQVMLLVEREGEPEPFEITVARARLQIPIVEAQMRDDDIGYLRLYEFSAPASQRLKESLRELLSQAPRAIILDLRDNPGGWLDQAVEVADLFLDDGVILYERWSDGGEQVFEAEPGDVGEEIPLVVLVNRNSASASEIVAGALQDRERAILIGEPTFGKGSVQRPFTLSDGSELRVTAARWFTPGDRAIHGEGLTPDIEVPWPEGGIQPDTDPQLERAVEYILTGD